MKFTILVPRVGEYSLNKIYAGMHWRKRQQQAKQWHLLVHSTLIREKIAREVLAYPVEVRIAYNDRLDIDNHGYIAKLIIDGLKGYLLADDTRKPVGKLTQAFHHGDGIVVEIVGM